MESLKPSVQSLQAVVQSLREDQHAQKQSCKGNVVEVDWKKTKAVAQYPVNLQRFLGMAGCYHRFVPNFSSSWLNPSIPSKGMELLFLILTSHLPSGCSLDVHHRNLLCVLRLWFWVQELYGDNTAGSSTLWKLTSFFIISSCWLWLCFSFLWFNGFMSPFASVMVTMS